MAFDHSRTFYLSLNHRQPGYFEFISRNTSFQPRPKGTKWEETDVSMLWYGDCPDELIFEFSDKGNDQLIL